MCGPRVLLDRYQVLCALFFTWHIHLGAEATGAATFACTSQVQMFSLFRDFIDGICCKQQAETCARTSALPSTCHSAACALAIGQVGASCLPWMAEPDQAWLRPFVVELTAAVKRCKGTKQAARTVALSKTSTASLFNACGVTLIDGMSDSGTSWDTGITLAAPKGSIVELHFNTLWLPAADSIRIYDGNSSRVPKITTIRGTLKPTQPIKSTVGAKLHVAMFHNSTKKPGEVSTAVPNCKLCWVATIMQAH
jgi:hypothetical protein